MGAPRLLAILGLILIGIVSRLLPHPPNFTAINSIALFSTLYLGNRWLSLATVVSTLFLSDLALGFHSTMPFVYLSFSLVLLLGYSLKTEMSIGRFSVISFASSSLFFLLTNFGSWMTGSLYSKTFSGLGFCYLAAVPFFVNQVLGDLAYAALLFGFISCVKAFQKNNYKGVAA